MKTCIVSRGLWAVAILKYLLCFSAGFSWLFNIWARSCSLFCCDWQLAPAGLLSDLVTVDADRHRLNLLTDSRLTSPETQTQIWNWLRQLPPRTFVVHCLQTVHCCACPASTMAEQLHPQQPSHDYTICWRYATYEISRNCPIRTALTFLCRHRRLYLSQTQNYQRMHISFEYALKMGAEGMFCCSKLQGK